MIERHKAIEIILGHVQPQDLVLTTTGMISREAFVADDRSGNFYMLGSMGLLSSFGLGLAILKGERRIFVLEGDGSVLMSLGTLPLIGVQSPANLIHIILDNEAYESTGGQPSISSSVDLADIARSSGYWQVLKCDDLDELGSALIESERIDGPRMILVKCSVDPVEGIPRISHSPTEIRDRFKSSIIDAVLGN